jgi:hypothetical protein
MGWLRRRADRRDESRPYGNETVGAAGEQLPAAEPVRLAHDPYDASLFAFLEESLVGAVPTMPINEHAAALARTLELANADWPEDEAVRELLALVDGDRRVLQRTQRVLQGGLLRTMLPNPLAIRAVRIAHAALQQSR